MGVRLRSMSEDSVDTYTHIWSVAFFFVLAFILLVLPQQQSQMPENNAIPAPEVVCWCPAQFEDSQVTYTNAICSKAYSENIRGKSHPQAFVAYLHDDKPGEPEDRMSSDSSDIKGDQSRQNSSCFRVPGPVVLFLLAMGLMLPRMLCKMMSKLSGCINVGRTLESLEKGDAMSGQNKHQIYSDVVKGFFGYSKTSGKGTTYLYLMMKMLVLSVLIGEIFFLTVPDLPNLQQTGLQSEHAQAMKTVNSTSSADRVDTLYEDLNIFFCSFSIKGQDYRGNRGEQIYVVQCKINETSETPNAFNVVFLAALCNLVILLVAHVLNTLLWLVNLASNSTRDRLGLGRRTPLDLVFLVQMARSNSSIGVAAALVDAVRCDELNGSTEIFKNNKN